MLDVKGSTRKNVVKALTVGLAVLMTGQPLVADASELKDNNIEDNDLNKEVQATNVADEAQTAADAAEQKADSSVMLTNTLTDAITDANDGVKSADTSNASAIQRTAAELAREDADGNTIVEAASEKIDDAKTLLDQIEQQDAAADTAAVSAVNNINGIDTAVETLNSDLDTALGSADMLLQTAEASENETEVRIALSDLETVAANAKSELDAAKANVSELEKAYEEAKTALLASQRTYADSLDQAKDDAKEAKADLDAASAKLSELKTQLEAANSEVKAANVTASKVYAAIDAVSGNTSVNEDAEENVFVKIMAGYYIPEVLERDATNIGSVYYRKIEGVSADYDYYELTYTVDGVNRTIYYGYVMEEGSADSIAVFEKTSQDRTVNSFMNYMVKETYGSNATDDQKRAYADEYTVCTMTMNGYTMYSTVKKSEAQSLNSNCTIVTNNANNNAAYYAAGNGVIQSSNAGLASLIKTVSSYNNLVKQADAAQKEVDEAKTAAAELESKADEIKAAANTVDISDTQVRNMLIALVSQYDSSTDFTKLSISDLMDKMDEILADSKAELANAEEKYDQIQGRLSLAQASYARFAADDVTVSTASIETDYTDEKNFSAASAVTAEVTAADKAGRNGTEINTDKVEMSVYSAKTTEKANTQKSTNISSWPAATSSSIDDFQNVESSDSILLTESNDPKDSYIWWSTIMAVIGTFGVGMFKRHREIRLSKEDDHIG